MKGLLIDPAVPEQKNVTFDPTDWQRMQDLVGGLFDYFVLRDNGGKPLALVYCADDASTIVNDAVFSFSDVTVLEKGALHYNWPIVGKGVLVGFDGINISDYTSALNGLVGSVDVFPDCASARSSAAYRSIPSNGATYITDKLHLQQQAGMLRKASSSSDPFGEMMKMIGGSPANAAGRTWAKSLGLDPTQTYMKHYASRDPRGFIPRVVGTSTSRECSVAELESAFLGLHEWARKKGGVHAPALETAFKAPPFFFPDGLEMTKEEFDAGVAVERGLLKLPFPLEHFWIVRWDTWLLGGGGAGEGPAMLHVIGSDAGFCTRDIYFDKQRGFIVGDAKEHDRLRQTPSALVAALHRLNNRRFLVERDYSTPELVQTNVGRAKSKRGLPPLPGFIRVTGRVRVSAQQASQSGIERCPHDRRAHWRKRKNGVELPPERWVRVRQTAIHRDAPREAAPKPYLVV